MSPDTDPIRYATAALLDLLPADAAGGTLRRVTPDAEVSVDPAVTPRAVVPARAHPFLR